MTWIRVGPRRGIANADEERRLSERRRASDLPFDGRPLPSAVLSDLDLDWFRREYLPSVVAPEVLQENGRTLQEQLESLRFTSDGVPTATGVLLAAFDPTRFLPGAYIQFLRLEGSSLADAVIDEERLAGPLVQLLRDAERLLTLNVRTAVDITASSTEQRRADYPLVALQQLVRNALLHRDYETSNAPVRISWFDDRIEIQSPGGPYGRVSIETFGRPGVNDYRNPFVAEAMKASGFVQRFGIGIETARRALEQNGNPPLQLEIDASNVLAIVRPAT